MKTERIEVRMTHEQFNQMQRGSRFNGRKVWGWEIPPHGSGLDHSTGTREIWLDVEVVEPRTDEVVTISPTAANEIFLELIKMRNQFEESAKKITSLLDKT